MELQNAIYPLIEMIRFTVTQMIETQIYKQTKRKIIYFFIPKQEFT